MDQVDTTNEVPNFLFLIIKYNKWRFIVLGIAVLLIIAGLICALIFDPIPLWGTLAASAIMGGVVGTGIWNWIKYKKWENENSSK